MTKYCCKTKMNYLLKNNRRENKTWKPVAGVAVILALAGFFYFFAPNLANQGLYKIAGPMWNARQHVGGALTNFWSIFADKATLASENLSLQQKLDEANLGLLDLDAYKQENDGLKILLGRKDLAEKKVLAVILAKPNQSAYDTLVLDVGKNQGVKAGDSVLAGDFIIGAVREVYDNYSKAVLASAPGETFTVRVGASGIDTQAQGRGGGNFIIQLPKEIAVKQGDLIKSPGLSPRIFGTVEDIEQNATDPFQFILFKLPVNINSLEWVEVVNSGQ